MDKLVFFYWQLLHIVEKKKNVIYGISIDMQLHDEYMT